MSLSPILGVDAVRAGSRSFEVASARLIDSTTSTDSAADPGAALADMSIAKAQFGAGLAVIRFSTQMWDALLQVTRDR